MQNKEKRSSSRFSPTVWLVAWVSLFTDISSEMLYPVMPLYLRSIGFSVFWIGLLEGLAEALAGLSKGYFGRRSDLSGKRVAYVRGGYLLSALSKPMLALSGALPWVFTARLSDRLGKGLRTSARDALLSAESSAENKGRVFGLHRGMDTLGAAIGPLMALAFLSQWPGHYQPLFLLAFLPALAGVGLTLLLRDPPLKNAAKTATPTGFLAYLGYWKTASPAYRRLLIGLLAFALFNSSDAFLLLRAREQGLSETGVLGLYIAYNLIYAAAALPAGSLADRWGMRRVLQAGLLIFAGVYAGFGWGFKGPELLGLFALYALYAACSESIAKAWIAQLVPLEETGTALGLFLSLASLATLLASTLAGLLWQWGFPALPFQVSALGSLGVWGYFVLNGKNMPEGITRSGNPLKK
ncbi:MFS transporter [bacterium (Candidatus Blackallbacteria) CG17_big_fil_post_rev_8_21_14_2_50_48_46]|uniref:MFS transporter n=1 Tax=bacterium (Candidatus Blackallbacteria) CG17_big_fil_post_rev_8_21_14_2_50_48_46 TaxID=2014261 RepID=A0A2M7FXF5_9BACT|nr:MAG: MFS transporter [bacterium (Candidatus Blackallbacteria) CG18_big_fil_WC_8_21_14_2_50_49_26]PIW13825.1 MAG: MFS transporter [bacterium (Candidatus Blackallbacteria) CG17_big_fil_post_rev_8_21_14_2_50_48_46]PIW45051.1 MAG: MFS transporter [bacterium (Candidatus Blackallbacteria) CG13_big_fil_rev_8_21_14_2_50_49_14]